MTEHELKMIALLDEGAKDAEAALADLKATWKAEDEATADAREKILEAHKQGAKDRDEARRRYVGGEDAEVVEDEKPKRASSLPAKPLSALDAKDEKKPVR